MIWVYHSNATTTEVDREQTEAQNNNSNPIEYK